MRERAPHKHVYFQVSEGDISLSATSTVAISTLNLDLSSIHKHFLDYLILNKFSVLISLVLYRNTRVKPLCCAWWMNGPGMLTMARLRELLWSIYAKLLTSLTTMFHYNYYPSVGAQREAYSGLNPTDLIESNLYQYKTRNLVSEIFLLGCPRGLSWAPFCLRF